MHFLYEKSIFFLFFVFFFAKSVQKVVDYFDDWLFMVNSQSVMVFARQSVSQKYVPGSNRLNWSWNFYRQKFEMDVINNCFIYYVSLLQLVHTCSLALASKGESIVAFIGLLIYSICFQPIISVDIRLAKYANRYSILLYFKN